MADRFSALKRSRIMSRIRGKDTGPEKLVRGCLRRMGRRFRTHSPELPGSPDIVFPRDRKVIFVHGCFWHGHKSCRRATRPKTNKAFWGSKIEGNIKRDMSVRRKLQSMGWKSLVLWQCRLKDGTKLRKRLEKFING